jgi:hypothetical protein
MILISCDPGKTTGFVRWDEAGSPIEMIKITGEDEACDWLEQQECTDFLYENYRNRPGAKNAHNIWSDNPTSQTLGALKRIARKKKWVLHEQEPQALAIGLRHLGLGSEYVKNGKPVHVPDDVSAMAHGEYFLRKKHIK